MKFDEDGSFEEDDESEEEEERENNTDDHARIIPIRKEKKKRRKGGRRGRYADFDEEEENFQPLPPPRETLLETERVLKRATKEQLSSSMTGEMPAKEQMEKLERALQKCVQMQKATASDDVKRERLLKKLETVLTARFDAVTIDPFGSFVSAFHTKNSDIDVSLTIHPSSQWYNEEEERKYRDAQSGAPRPRDAKEAA